MKHLSFDFLRVSEVAALAAYPFIGSGDKMGADGAATEAMRKSINNMKIAAQVVIGEGELDQAPMLAIGERLGQGIGDQLDIAVDPIEGTTLTVNGQGNAITTLAIAPSGSLLHAPDMYMKKLAVGPQAKGKIDLAAPLIDNLYAVADANGKTVEQLNVCLQNRPRHREFIQQIRAVGAKVHLFEEGDVTYTIATCLGHLDIDMFVGIGGAPEGVVSAVALKALGGEMQAQLLPETEQEMLRCQQMGLYDPYQILQHKQLVDSQDCLFLATGITDSICLAGVKKDDQGFATESLLITGQDSQCRYVRSFYARDDQLIQL
ncbi:class II fructose-bisphosphatase [Amphibacillus sediminis]|uniref:class II fructose-bisphosphatase n=1 Tax=Amphibacillus sediminis TaxID=360185 RepID=UPI00082C85B6|nr:class II fructose-bisphosphatase [Amphibacillus sediminis]